MGRMVGDSGTILGRIVGDGSNAECIRNSSFCFAKLLNTASCHELSTLSGAQKKSLL